MPSAGKDSSTGGSSLKEPTCQPACTTLWRPWRCRCSDGHLRKNGDISEGEHQTGIDPLACELGVGDGRTHSCRLRWLELIELFFFFFFSVIQLFEIDCPGLARGTVLGILLRDTAEQRRRS
jgi:hypothetical protein